MTGRCAECGAVNPGTARWCGRCGTPLYEDAPPGASPGRRNGAPGGAADAAHTSGKGIAVGILVVAVALVAVEILLGGAEPGSRGGPVDVPSADISTSIDGAVGRPGASLPTCRIGPTMTVPLVGSPCRRWTVASPGGERDWLASDGDLYLTDGHGFVEARTLDDGIQRWAVRTTGATQLRAEGQATLYVTVDDRVLLALGRGDGALRWEHRIDAAAEELPGAGETIRRVLATASKVYLQVGATMTALDVDDGSADWSWSEQHVLSAGTIGDRPFVVVVDGVIGLGPTTGEPRWRVPRVTFDNRPHVTSGGDVVIGDDTSHVSLVSGRTGAVRWTRDLGALPVSIAVTGDRVTVQGRPGRLWSLGRDDGRIRWAVGATPEPLELLDAGPEMVLARTRSRPDVVAIDAVSGRERWRREVAGLQDAHLRGDEAVIDAEGEILVVDTRDGIARWTLPLEGRVLRAAPDPLLVSSAGTLVAVDAPARSVP